MAVVGALSFQVFSLVVLLVAGLFAAVMLFEEWRART